MCAVSFYLFLVSIVPFNFPIPINLLPCVTPIRSTITFDKQMEIMTKYHTPYVQESVLPTKRVQMPLLLLCVLSEILK